MNAIRRLRFWAHLILAGRPAHDAHVAYLHREMEEARKEFEDDTSVFREFSARKYAAAYDAYHKFCGH